MRIALFTDSNIHFLDGVARIIQELIKYIQARPEHSLVVFHRENDKPGKVDFGPNVAAYGIAAPCVTIPGYDAYPILYLKSPKKQIKNILKDNPPDISITITPYIPRGIGNSSLYVSKKLNRPLVGSFDVPLSWYSEYYIQKLFKIGLIARFLRWRVAANMKNYRHCNMILVPSHSMDEYVKKEYGDMDTFLFHRAVDSESFNTTHRSSEVRAKYKIEDKIVFIFVGRLALEKNLSALTTAFATLKAKYANIAMLMVGEGPERESIEKQNLPDLIFTGALFGDDLRRAYASADIFVYPSIVDAGPMAILEAMASGLPAVVFKGGGTHEVVKDGETGFVVEDNMQFERNLEQLICDDRIRSTMKTNARKHAESRDWNLIWDQIVIALGNTIKKYD
jgi:phosphatidylinositol alpha 1,6-mannosyltransferase